MLGRFMCRLFCILVLVLLSTLPSTRSTITTASTTIPQATFNSPVLPTSLPLPLKAPRLVTNRWVNTSVEYDVWVRRVYCVVRFCCVRVCVSV